MSGILAGDDPFFDLHGALHAGEVVALGLEFEFGDDLPLLGLVNTKEPLLDSVLHPGALVENADAVEVNAGDILENLLIPGIKISRIGLFTKL